ncbi:hypothetical protein ANCCAN_12991 [Ancylostoma caninum]|uniref:Uncharacterized protein n=1 Tax=Ancylostoma caninum TaxID=29170 RepID=A0A368G9H7_ANCCA|nr:hypothetical protein ANCCAN_12991 [Ancylostoma caninum]
MFSRHNFGGGDWTRPNTRKCWEGICSFFERCTAPFSRFSPRQLCCPRASFKKNWLQEHYVYTVNWRACLSDCNQVKNMWGIIVRHVYRNKEQYSTVDDLRAVILDVWDQIGDNATQNLVKSMPLRTFEVIYNDGGAIDY